MVHAAAETNHPVRQGLYGIFEVFVDTILICTTTALVILVTDTWHTGATGAEGSTSMPIVSLTAPPSRSAKSAIRPVSLTNIETLAVAGR